ncbi:MAG: acyl carrier protein [Myxococcota bacterium]
MTEAEVLDTVSEVIRAEAGGEATVGPDTHLIDHLGLDSLNLLSITVELENRFERCLEPEGDDPLLRVGDIVAALLRKGRAGEAS